MYSYMIFIDILIYIYIYVKHTHTHVPSHMRINCLMHRARPRKNSKANEKWTRRLVVFSASDEILRQTSLHFLVTRVCARSRIALEIGDLKKFVRLAALHSSKFLMNPGLSAGLPRTRPGKRETAWKIPAKIKSTGVYQCSPEHGFLRTTRRRSLKKLRLEQTARMFRNSILFRSNSEVISIRDDVEDYFVDFGRFGLETHARDN